MRADLFAGILICLHVKKIINFFTDTCYANFQTPWSDLWKTSWTGITFHNDNSYIHLCKSHNRKSTTLLAASSFGLFRIQKTAWVENYNGRIFTVDQWFAEIKQYFSKMLQYCYYEYVRGETKRIVVTKVLCVISIVIYIYWRQININRYYLCSLRY